MCLVLFAYKQHPEYALVVAANRDEFHARPTTKAGFWPQAPKVFAGCDEKGGGTWMGVTRKGRFAILTNIRDIAKVRGSVPSRGGLVSDFLIKNKNPRKYLETVSANAQKYNPFNLLAGSRDEIFYCTSHDRAVKKLSPGFYGLSNWTLDTPWPKVEKGKQAIKKVFKNLEHGSNLDREALFSILADNLAPPANMLPDTGIGLEWERELGSIFVKSPGYGTRSSTVLIISKTGAISVEERSFGPQGPEQGLICVSRTNF